MDTELLVAKLRKEFPEIEEHVIQEALRNNDFDFRRASEALRARFYKDDSGIPQEKSFWSTLSNPVAPTTAAQSSRGSAEWSLDNFTDGMNALGMQLLMGVEVVADTLGSLGDLIPDLIFGADESYDEANPAGAKDKDEVVVGGNRGGLVKKRATPAAKGEPATAAVKDEDEHGTDEETDDWTKED